MKKIVFVVTLLFIVLSMTGCSSVKDNFHATATISTSSSKGKYIVPSYNGSDSFYSGKELSDRNKFVLNIADHETAEMRFQCDSCGYDESITLTAPFTKDFSCECPENGSTSLREYLSVVTEEPESDTK